jgi:hypothetical protein
MEAILDDYHDTVLMICNADQHQRLGVGDAGASTSLMGSSLSLPPSGVASDFIHQPMPQRTPPVNRKTGGPNRSTNFQNLLQKRN